MRSTDEDGLPLIRWRGVGSRWRASSGLHGDGELIAGDTPEPAPVVRLPVQPKLRPVSPPPPAPLSPRALRNLEDEAYARRLLSIGALSDAEIARLANLSAAAVRMMRGGRHG